MASPGKVRIGISGWTYKPWRGVFYPKDLKQKHELEYASKTFNSIEINGTFYSLQRPTSFERWAAETPDDFVFSVKAPRFITHIRRLKDADGPVSNFMASGIFRLGAKLGPILWQLPPNFHFKPEVLEDFFKLLPHDTDEAAACARRHDKWMANRAELKSGDKRPMRHAMEIRARQLRHARIHTSLAEIRCRAGLRRHRGMAALDGSDFRFYVLPPAWLGSSVRQRLRRRIFGSVDYPRGRLGAWQGT